MTLKTVGGPCFALALGFLSLGTVAEAQETFPPTHVLRTTPGAGSTLTATQTFVLPETAEPLRLHLAFGFSTSETPAPQTFYDSLTLTLRDTLTNAALFATIDLLGPYWAPEPGGLPIDPQTIQHEPAPFPSLLPEYPTQWAYEVFLPVPSVMAGQEVTLYLDLFDNQNSAGSLGWMSEVVVVPEPTAAAMLGLGLGWLLLRARRARAA